MKNIIFYTFVGVLMLASCEKELDVNFHEASPQLVINSKVFQDSTFIVSVYRTSLIAENHNNLWYIDTAAVNIYMQNRFIETLELDSLGKYKGTHRIKPNTIYTIKVAVNGFPEATAQTTTLSKTQIIRIDSIGKVTDSETQQTMYKFAVIFKDNDTKNDFYMVDFSEYSVGNENTPISSKDPSIEVGKDGYTNDDGTTDYWSFYLSDELFNGNEYGFSFFVPEYKVYEGFTVNLSHITPEYFKYIQTLDAQNKGDGLEMFYQAVQVYNNVENGLGIFGVLSSCTQEYKYEYQGQ